MMMMRRGSCKTILLAEIVMFRRVRMTGEAHRVSVNKERQEFGLVADVHRRVAGIEIVLQRNVHNGDDEARGWGLSQHIGDKSALTFAKKAPEFAAAARLGRVNAEIINVVQHQKQRVAIFESVIIGAKHAFERLTAIAGIRCLEVQIMVAACRRYSNQEVYGSPICHNVSRRNPEGSLDIDQPISGCGSAKSTTSKRFGSSVLMSPKSTDAGNGPVGGRPG